MFVTVQYQYPDDEKQDPQAKVQTETFEVPVSVFENALAHLSIASTKEN